MQISMNSYASVGTCGTNVSDLTDLTFLYMLIIKDTQKMRDTNKKYCKVAPKIDFTTTVFVRANYPCNHCYVCLE